MNRRTGAQSFNSARSKNTWRRILPLDPWEYPASNIEHPTSKEVPWPRCALQRK